MSTIPYALQDLPITPDPNDKSGRVLVRGSLTEDDILQRMLKRGTGISQEDMQATLDLFTKEISDSLTDGWNINTRIANFKPGIKGVFISATDPFDRSRHHFRASLSEGVTLKKKMRNAKGERISNSLPLPAMIQFMDYASRTTDSILTPGNIGELVGEELKFNSKNPAEGIFFINETENTVTKVDTISILTEGKLMFQVPANLTIGEYRLEVRRAYTNQNTIRTGTLTDSLSIGG